MRYKVNFHVLLWFLSSCTTIIMSNQETVHRSNDSKHHNITTKHTLKHAANDNKNHKTAHNYDESHSVSTNIGSPPNDLADSSSRDMGK